MARRATTSSAPSTADSSPVLTADDEQSKLYKTELCRSYMDTGYCRYSNQCKFAHGEVDLRRRDRHPRYKSEICRSFWNHGTCRYGSRCDFRH
ncbi:hypothetical protein BJ085DRAFT_18778, partial [Dimargaris cristalligena]